ncbi:MAG: hypothetical protein BWK80_19925 [Desulfobacteraceae bacterium IS3]|nr:MAG: hypothetical protein BWK80_19925 [Desulfobacteraceae bacterium IS3]
MTELIKKNKMKIAAGVIFVFFLGVVSGSLLTGIYLKHRIKDFIKGGPFMKELSVKRLSSKLDLTTAQKIEIEKIVDNTLIQLREFRERHRPEIEGIIDRAVSLIKEKLNEEQKRKMDKLHEKLKRHWRDEHGRD